MRIALCANTSWNVFNFRLSLLKALQSEGHEIFVISPRDKKVDVIKAEGFNYVELHKLSRKGQNPLTDILLLFELRKIIKKYQFDTVLLYTIKPVIYGSLASWNTKTKVISTITGLGYSFISSGLTNRIAKNLYQWALKLNTNVFFQNQDDRQLFIDEKLITKSQSDVIPGSGIRTDLFYPQPRIKPADGQFNFLFVGRILKDKGVHELIEATSKLIEQKVNLSLTIAGGVDKGNPSIIDYELFEKFIKHPQINYLGEVGNVKNIIVDCDAVVLPSYREGIPRVLLEAMSMAKPIITTDVPGCRQVIRDEENGLLVKVKDSSALKEAMLEMVLLSDEKRSEMGQKGRTMAVEIFDQKIINKTYSNLIARLDMNRDNLQLIESFEND